MDGSTKILTVSYGTFSCTLEGFEDPLGAMRDIAEYFRDLAADDRYFGAEPPTPDVEMLQNIAEKEVNRRVEARLSDTGVALRQVDHKPEPDLVQPEPEAEDPSNTPDADDAIAARVASAARESSAAEADTPDTGSGPLTFDDDFLMADEPEDVLAVDPSARVAADGPAESVAEKLRRIRAVVSRNIESKATPEAPKEGGDAAQASQKRDRALTETIEQITADLAEDEETEPEGTVAEAVASEPDVDAAEDTTSDENAEPKPAEKLGRDTSEPLWVRDDQAEDEGEDQDVLLAEPDASDADDGDFDAAESLFTSDDKAEASSEAEAKADDAEDDDEGIERRISDIIGNLSERINEENEEDNPEDDAEIESLDASGAQTGAVRHPVTRLLSNDQDGDVGRLMAETDTKLNEDDVVRRRRVISQMRAAVAATKADRLVSRQVPREAVEELERSPYRNDLSQAVRTNKGGAESGGRAKTASPPLVLVSSQRVDSKEAFGDSEETSDIPEDFADFAATMGAKELPELLEAAAAYTVFGEGHPSFTRPEIMKRVAAVDPTIRMSREESLRSFGQLLRQGKFRKLERGQFTIDQDTKFNPKHRIAGE